MAPTVCDEQLPYHIMFCSDGCTLLYTCTPTVMHKRIRCILTQPLLKQEAQS